MTPARFEVGQRVLIDEGPRGIHEIVGVEPGDIPAINPADLADEEFTKPGYWYTVQPPGKARTYRAAEFNVDLAPWFIWICGCNGLVHDDPEQDEPVICSRCRTQLVQVEVTT